jgi:hypothetical protein
VKLSGGKDVVADGDCFLPRPITAMIARRSWSTPMTARLGIFACCALLLTGLPSPAAAGQHWRFGHGGAWRQTHQAIYERENRIAFLEADPEIDDGAKAPIVTRVRAEVTQLRATLRPPQWRWVSPCCYSRRPIYIR